MDFINTDSVTHSSSLVWSRTCPRIYAPRVCDVYDVHIYVRTNIDVVEIRLQPGPMVPSIAHPNTVTNRSDMEYNVSKRSRSCAGTEQQDTPMSPQNIWDAAGACTCWNVWYATVGRIEPVHMHVSSHSLCVYVFHLRLCQPIRVRICMTWRKHNWNICRAVKPLNLWSGCEWPSRFIRTQDADIVSFTHPGSYAMGCRIALTGNRA